MSFNLRDSLQQDIFALPGKITKFVEINKAFEK